MTHSSHLERRRHLRADVAAVATLYVGEDCRGHYLVRNLSVGGALLVSGPALPSGTSCQVVLRGPGLGSTAVPLAAETLRASSTRGEPGLAIAFQALPKAIEETLAAVVQGASEQTGRRAILVVDSDLDALATLAEDLARLGQRPLLARTPLEAVRWICDLETRIDAAFVSSSGVPGGGADLLAFIGEEFPHVHRVLVHGPLPAADLLALLDESSASTSLRAPWTPTSVERALSVRPSRRPSLSP